jgi:hypothetical protein
MCISTAAIVGIGTAITNASKIVPKINFLIFLPPPSLKNDPLLHRTPKTCAIRFSHIAIFSNLSTFR